MWVFLLSNKNGWQDQELRIKLKDFWSVPMIDARQSWGSIMAMVCSVIVDAKSVLATKYLKLKLKFNRNKIQQLFLLPIK